MRTPALDWVAELLRPKPAPVPWGRAVRTAVAIVTPVAVGMSIGQVGPGTLCSIGALAASIADQGGAYRRRTVRICIAALAGAFGFLVGGLVFGAAGATIVVVLLAGLVSGFVSVLGSVASVASLQFLIFLLVASGTSFGGGPAWVPPLFYLLGAAWLLLLSLASGIGRRTAPERVAVAEFFRALALLMEVAGSDQVDSARQGLTAAMNTAYDTVVSSRATSAGRDPRVRRLAALLNAATPVVETTLTLVRDQVTIPLQASATVRQMAARILRGSHAAATADTTTVRDASAEVESPATIAALETGLNTISAILTEKEPADAAPVHPPTLTERMRALRDALASGPVTWLPVIRLVICLGVAEVAGYVLQLDRSYWVALTVAVTLKPDFGSVFARAVQRGLGTVVGVLIGTVLLVFVPFGVPILAAIALLAFMLPITLKRNYGMFATFLTPVIVLLLDLSHRNDQQLILSRLTDTVIGCAIVLIIGYLPWPNVWRSRSVIGDRVADATDAVLAYLRVALGTDDGARTTVRRQTYRRMSDLRTQLQQALAEPPPTSTHASAWWPAIVALERLTDAVTAAVTRAELGGTAPQASSVDLVIAEMEEISRAMRAGRRPGDLTLPDDPELDGVVAELRVAHSVLTGSVPA